MDEWTFGITMMVVGTGGTFITMAVLILVTYIFKKIFPVERAPESADNAK
jgi:Na+-transporting methylmalonyl-CoA/oxaloacetate decarboxylase gamma subunit